MYYITSTLCQVLFDETNQRLGGIPNSSQERDGTTQVCRVPTIMEDGSVPADVNGEITFI